MGRVALLVNALSTGRLGDLRLATGDRLHQPYRQRLFPAMKVIFKAALDAGALGVFLSGSGSTILALTRGMEMTVAYEMAEAARQANVEGKVKITRPSIRGAHPVAGSEAAVE
jgi:homoserine kinase